MSIADVELGNVERHVGGGLPVRLERASGPFARTRTRLEAGMVVRRVLHALLIEERGDAPGRLDPEPKVGELSIVAPWRRGDPQITYRQVARTRDFAEQREGELLGSLDIMLR